VRRLAAEADARWEAKPRLGDPAPAAPALRPPARETDRSPGPGSASASAADERAEVGAGTGTGEVTLGDGEAAKLREETWERMKREAEAREQMAAAADPWRQHARGAPGETWQPQSWEPTAREKK
ncbi:hypothetical protein VTH06DRAFT_8621, partial [Thermothelomyces fergusii]